MKPLQTWATQLQLQANHLHTQDFIVQLLAITPGAFNSPEFARSSKAYVTATGSNKPFYYITTPNPS